MSEPRTRTAADVADHASILLDDIQRALHVHETLAARPMAGTSPVFHAELAGVLRFLERLTAQVEDVSDAVARSRP